MNMVYEGLKRPQRAKEPTAPRYSPALGRIVVNSMQLIFVCVAGLFFACLVLALLLWLL